jgi:hypothetical protein
MQICALQTMRLVATQQNILQIVLGVGGGAKPRKSGAQSVPLPHRLPYERELVQQPPISIVDRDWAANPCKCWPSATALRRLAVMDKTLKVLLTYPITFGTSNPSPKDVDFEKAALSSREGREAGSRVRLYQPEDTHAHGHASRGVI